jgi:hypothetical protein
MSTPKCRYVFISVDLSSCRYDQVSICLALPVKFENTDIPRISNHPNNKKKMSTNPNTKCRGRIHMTCHSYISKYKIYTVCVDEEGGGGVVSVCTRAYVRTYACMRVWKLNIIYHLSDICKVISPIITIMYKHISLNMTSHHITSDILDKVGNLFSNDMAIETCRVAD